MGLSEHEAEERLAQLRRQREALDREIADLVLYLELGRRLKAGAPRPATPDPLPVADHLAPAPDPWPTPWPEPEAVPTFASPPPRPRRPSAPEPVAFAEDPTGARRYGRALIEAACAILAAAGQPLHARDIHDGLIARGFAIPGRDPVAALNTRLWKRSGEGGPLRRHGDAVYGLAEE
ncbi:hypothetical protein ACFQE0_19995 [Methylobacterium komagatae]|uniref:HTH HARE-type domain-containing protein n=1 Tax=Methylobacterium komagatae TaxID=374425 RepID=A0ABW2BMI9_9HYPH